MRVEPTWRSPLAQRYVDEGHWRGQLIDSFLDDAAGVAIVDRERRVDFAELVQRSEAAAALLSGLGVGRGDVVSWQLPNWLDGAVIHYGALRLGAVSNPIIPIYRGRELRFILRQAGSRVIVVPEVFRGFHHAALAGELRTELPALEHVLVAGDSFEQALERAGAPPRVERSASDAALLLYTSGTEADPKGVIHTHDTLVYEARSIIGLYRLDGRDRVFMPSPITHITGVVYGLQMPAMLRTRCVLQDVWKAETALELIERERCSVVIGATPFLHGLAYSPERKRRDVSSLRVFGCGGADVPPELIRSASELLGCRASRLYGSTECPAVTGTDIDAPGERHATTDGRPVGGGEAKLAGRELHVRGPELCAGYLDPALNERAFDADGWFRTGDLAAIDVDGYVRIAGRAKDVIVRGGENISAKEVEDLLFEHPAVAEVALVAYPDDILGERACAMVVPAAGAEPALEDLVAFLRERDLAKQKLPERVELVAELPKTASGKVQKFRLRERLRESSGMTA